MKNEKTIEALNSLITINNDRIEGYETASSVTEEIDLKMLFAKFLSTSIKNKQELVAQVRTIGGEVAEGTKNSGKFFRVWMDVKAALTGKDRKAILSSCEFGEDAAKNTYDNVLENQIGHLSVEQQLLVNDQKSRLRADHEHVRALLSSQSQA